MLPHDLRLCLVYSSGSKSVFRINVKFCKLLLLLKVSHQSADSHRLWGRSFETHFSDSWLLVIFLRWVSICLSLRHSRAVHSFRSTPEALHKGMWVVALRIDTLLTHQVRLPGVWMALIPSVPCTCRGSPESAGYLEQALLPSGVKQPTGSHAMGCPDPVRNRLSFCGLFRFQIL